MLPKINCKDCGSPSCLAFAMKVAAGKASFTECPYLSYESRTQLEEMMEPPMIEIRITRNEKEIILGGEKVLYRHDETFYHPTAVCIAIPPGLSQEKLEEKISHIESLSFKRAGESLSIDMVAISDPAFTPDFVEKVYRMTQLPIIVKTGDSKTINKIINWELCEGVIIFTHIETVMNFMDVLRERKIPVAINAPGVKEAEKTGKFFKENGIKNGIIAVSSGKSSCDIETLYSIRLEALTTSNKLLSFPTMLWVENSKTSLFESAAAILKYGSIVVISNDSPEQILPLLTLRHNIFTDPRRPIQVEAKLYEIGAVTPESPVLVTTNFSLTYFMVAQEIEASRVPSYLLIIDTDGTSVLTAWSADRFNANSIVAGINKANLDNIVMHGEIVIPGYVSMLKEEIEKISSWKVRVGPAEAAGIPQFLRRLVDISKNSSILMRG